MENILNILDEYIFILNKNGKIMYCNDKLLSKLKYIKEEIKSLNIDNILDNESYKDIVSNIDNKIDLSLFSKDKKLIHFTSDIKLSKWKDEECIFIVCKDINEKYYNKEDLEELLDTIQIGTWIKDLDCRYLYINKEYSNSMKVNKEFVLNKIDKSIHPKDQCIIYSETDKEILGTKKPLIYENKVIDNGIAKYYEMFKKPIFDENNNVKYIAGTFKDITERKIFECELTKNHSNMIKLYDLIKKNDINLNLEDVLNEFLEDIAQSLEADGLTFSLYDEEKQVLIPKFKHGHAKIILKDVKEVKVSKKDIDELLEGKQTNSIGVVKNNYILDENISKEFNIGYGYSYGILLDGKYNGSLSISYTNDNIPRYNVESFIQTIAIEIGMIIKHYKLSKALKDELKKRKETQERLDLFLNTATDIMATMDENGYFKYLGPNWEETFGWSEEEILSKSLLQLIHPEYRLAIDKKNSKSEELKKLKIKCLSKDNSIKWIDFRIRYRKDKKEYILTGKDITEEKKYEEEIKDIQRIIQLENIKNEFFANISHEFKTPINMILGTTQLLDRSTKEDTGNSIIESNLSKYTSLIKQNSYRLLRLVNNLIDMTRIDTGFYDVNFENYNIIEIIEDITMAVSKYIKDKGINIIFDTNYEEVVTSCDPDKIERIMLNLLSNAIKYIDGNGTIMVDVKYIRDKVVVSVKDNGCGITKDKISLIFEMFGQANDYLTRPCEGSGIGLSLVKSLVEIHNGNIYVNSEENKGSEFMFEIPIKLEYDKNGKALDTKKYIEFEYEKCNIEFSDIYSI